MIRVATEAELSAIVAIYNATIAGPPAYRATAELSIYVAANRQRKGSVSVLLARAIKQAPRVGLKTLLGFIFAPNDASLRLFEKFGFQRWGVLPRVAELDEVARDLIIVGRPVLP